MLISNPRLNWIDNEMKKKECIYEILETGVSLTLYIKE